MHILLIKQFGEVLHHRSTELLYINDSDGSAVIAGNVMADTDGEQFDWRA